VVGAGWQGFTPKDECRVRGASLAGLSWWAASGVLSAKLTVLRALDTNQPVRQGLHVCRFTPPHHLFETGIVIQMGIVEVVRW